MNDEIASLRSEYRGQPFDPEDAASEPLPQFESWLNEARAACVPEVTAMTLATVNAHGEPRARVVLLKAVDTGFVFYTNYQSDKGRELDASGAAALNFFWQPLHRQVRVVGSVARVLEDESDAYFASRPRGSQIGAWASDQSRPLATRHQLELRAAELEERFAGTVPRPPHWGGYRLTPTRVEFWQGRENRLHDRVLYTRRSGAWTRSRLAP